MEQNTGSKSGKEYVKAVYCHPVYLTYTQEKEMANLQYSWLENSMDRGAGRLQSMKTERVRHTQKECTHTQTPSVLDGNLFK